MSEHQGSAYEDDPTYRFIDPQGAREDVLAEIADLRLTIGILNSVCANKDEIIAGVLEERDALKAIIESGGAEERVVRFLVRIKDLHTQFYSKGEPFTLRMNVADSLQSLFREAGLP